MAALRGQAQTFERALPGPDGVMRHGLAHYLPHVIDGVVGLLVEVTDVTPVKQATAALQAQAAERERAHALLRTAIDAIDDGFVLFDPDDRLVFCNNKYLEIYAASADLVVPGASFEHIVRTGAERGQYPQAVGRVHEWVAERMAAHRVWNTNVLQRLDDGRVLRILAPHRRWAHGGLSHRHHGAGAGQGGGRVCQRSQVGIHLHHQPRTARRRCSRSSGSPRWARSLRWMRARSASRTCSAKCTPVATAC